MKKVLSVLLVVLGLGAALVGDGAWAADIVNLARTGRAFQSSTEAGADASRAIDGNTDGDWSHGSVSHTSVDDQAPRWNVVLPSHSLISKIVIWNRTDCCSNRLTNFEVEIKDGMNLPTYSGKFFTDGVSFPDTTQSGYQIDIPPGTDGYDVSIMLPYSGDPKILSLAEVEVLGQALSPSPPPPKLAQKNGDVNGSGVIDLSDAVYLLNTLFLGGPEPVPFDCQRFQDNGDGTVTDATTGLMWQKETAEGIYAWGNAQAICELLQLGGHDDWRLPEVWELWSIFDHGRQNPAIDPVFGAVPFYYWSSTSGGTFGPWNVLFCCDLGGVVSDEDEVNAYLVRAVRNAP